MINELKGYLGTGLMCDVKKISGFEAPQYIHENEVLTIELLNEINLPRKHRGKAVSFKPLLYPLSKLTEEIEHNGENIIPATVLEILEHGETDGFFHQNCTWIPEGLSFRVVQKLFEYHCDVHGLIDQGKAIDVTTLEVNPYK